MVASIVVFTVLSAAAYVVLPLLVGATVETLGFTVLQAGWIAAADTVGAGVAALSLSFWISRGHWQSMLFASLGVLVIANFLSGLTQDFLPLFFCRVLAGLCEGGLLSIANASIGETGKPDRVFGLAACAQLAFGAPALYVIPSALAAYGIRGIFWGLAALNLPAFALVRYVPNRTSGGRPAVGLPPARLPARSLLGLAAVFVYFAAQGGVWAYLEQMGTAKHLGTPEVGQALAISSIAGLLGAALASWLDIRWQRFKPLLIGGLCTIVSLLALNGCAGFAAFAAVVSCFYFAWNFSVPYEFGALTEMDASRRTIVLGGVVTFAGMTAGPPLAATLIGQHHLFRVIVMGIVLSVLSLALFGGLLLPLERRSFGRLRRQTAEG